MTMREEWEKYNKEFLSSGTPVPEEIINKYSISKGLKGERNYDY